MSMTMTSKSAVGAPRQQMNETKPTERFLRFGQFQVDLQRGELLKEGSRVHIQTKVFQVLLALVERPGQIVTRESLRTRLWPDGTFVNYDANVNTTVNKLRLTLGDSPEKPMYVETIPRKGYCFLGNVERCNDLLDTTSALTIGPAEAIDGPAEQQEASSIVASGGFAALFTNGWGAAMLLCGVLIGVGIGLLMHRAW